MATKLQAFGSDMNGLSHPYISDSSSLQFIHRTMGQRYCFRAIIGLLLALDWYSLPTLRLQAEQCLPPPGGLVRWYEGNGNATERLGTGWGFWTNGTPSYVTGKVRHAFQFDGASQVAIGYTPELDNATGVTVCAWIRPAKKLQNCGIISGSGFRLTMGSGPFSDIPGFEVASQEGRRFQGGGWTNLLPVGEWTFIAGTWDSSDNRIRVYSNGELVDASGVTPPGFRLSSINPPGSQDLIGGDSFGFGLFVGGVDEVQIFNRSLSSEEIQGIYKAGTAGLCPLFFTSKPEARNIEVGSAVTFDSAASAGPAKIVKYQWQFNGKDIDGATSASLTLPKTKNDQAGTYTVVATSSDGESISASAQLSFSFVSIHLYAGVTINGAVGSKWRIEYAEGSDATSWTTLETLTLSTTPQTYIDLSSGKVANRFYRAIPAE